MSVRNLAAIEKRIAKVEQRSRVLDVPRLTLIDVLSWPHAEREAHATGDESTRAELESRLGGPLPNPPSRFRVAAIVVTEHGYDEANAWRYDDDEVDDPSPRPSLSQAERDAIAARNAEAMQAAAAEIDRERGAMLDGVDPLDPNPDADPQEVLYFNEQSGYPVTRAEHRLKRQRAREEWERRARYEQARRMERNR